MFKPIQYDSGKAVMLPMAVSKTVAVGDALDFASGYVQPATSSSPDGTIHNPVRYVALEGATTDGSTHTQILCLPVKGVRFEADTTGNMSQAYVGTSCDLTDAATLNEDAVSVHIFFIEAISGATTDKKAIGYFDCA